MYEAFLIMTTAMIFSKLLDCLSTLEWVTPHTETNPIAAPLMKRYGMRTTVWGFFLVCSALDVSWASLAYKSESPAIQALFLAAATLFTVGRTSVAHTNATGRFGKIEHAVVRVYNAWPRRR